LKVPLLLAIALLMLPAGAQAQYVMDVGNLILELRIGDLGDSIEQFDAANTVYVARLSRIPGVRVSQRSLDLALDSRRGMVASLQAIVRQKRLAMKTLEIHHESVEDVVFITTTADGTATLYVDDR